MLLLLLLLFVVVVVMFVYGYCVLCNIVCASYICFNCLCVLSRVKAVSLIVRVYVAFAVACVCCCCCCYVRLLCC